MNTVGGWGEALWNFLSSILSVLTEILHRLEIQFRLMQTAGPGGAGRDEGPTSVPVLITKRQGTCRQIDGNGLGRDAGHAW